MDKRDVKITEHSVLWLYFHFVLVQELYLPIKELKLYLDENTYIFTLIGVFGAISVYSIEVMDMSGQSGASVGRYTTFIGFGIILLLAVVTVVDLIRRGIITVI